MKASIPGAKPGLALVTGVSGGIGRAVAQRFTAEGYRVFGIDRTERSPDLSVDRYSKVDLEQLVARPEVCESLISEVEAWIGNEGLAALVNNAAVQICRPTEELRLEDWNTSLAVNLLAPFVLVKNLLGALERVHGCVLNVSSIHARLTKPHFPVYATTKAALSGLTRALAVDLGPRIRVNAIEPAAIETEMLKDSFIGRGADYQLLAACHPAGRVGQPSEVAALAYAIVAGEFRFLNGACVDLSGGISARLHDPA